MKRELLRFGRDDEKGMFDCEFVIFDRNFPLS